MARAPPTLDDGTIMDAYRPLFRHLLWPFWEGVVRRRPTMPRWSYLERTQWESPSELRRIQTQELRRLLLHARENIPYYRDVFARLGFEPNEVRSPADLRALPRLTKDIVRERYADLIDRRTADLHVHKRTSGSSGVPFRFEYDRDSEVWRQAVRWRGYGMAGYRPGARVLYYWGLPIALHGVHGFKVQLDRLCRREGFLDCYQQDEASLEAAVRAIRRSRPSFLIGFTVATAILARYILDRGLRYGPPITVLCAAEAARGRDREDIEAAFGAKSFDTYGARETMLIATECEQHQGLHTMDENLVVEVDAGGRPAAPGEPGDVLVTDLHNYGMPLIRFENGDMAIPAEDRPCACGRGLGRLEGIIGRQSETLRNAHGEPVPGMLVHSLITHANHQLRQVQVVQRASGEVILKVVCDENGGRTGLDAIAATVRKYLRGLPVTVQPVRSIDSGPSGKRACIVVERAESSEAERAGAEQGTTPELVEADA